MGDRANVYVKNSDTTGVYLYTHWDGSELPEIVRAALARSAERHDDAQYLARVVFCEMVRDDVDGQTGYGITAELGDNSYPIIVLDCDAETVAAARQGSERQGPYVAVVPMKAFAEMDDDALEVWRSESASAPAAAHPAGRGRGEAEYAALRGETWSDL